MPTYYVESVNSFHFILFWICCHKWLDDEKLFVTSLKTQYYFANSFWQDIHNRFLHIERLKNERQYICGYKENTRKLSSKYVELAAAIINTLLLFATGCMDYNKVIYKQTFTLGTSSHQV